MIFLDKALSFYLILPLFLSIFLRNLYYLYCALLCTIFKLNLFNSWKQTKVQTRILLPKTSEAVRRYKKAIEHVPGIAWHRGLSNGAETTSRPNPQPSQWLWGEPTGGGQQPDTWRGWRGQEDQGQELIGTFGTGSGVADVLSISPIFIHFCPDSLYL